MGFVTVKVPRESREGVTGASAAAITGVRVESAPIQLHSARVVKIETQLFKHSVFVTIVNETSTVRRTFKDFAAVHEAIKQVMGKDPAFPSKPLFGNSSRLATELTVWITGTIELVKSLPDDQNAITIKSLIYALFDIDATAALGARHKGSVDE